MWFCASCFKIPKQAAKLVHQNSPSAKGPQRQPVDGQVFCKSFKSSPIHTYFQPWDSPLYSKSTPKWLCLIVFTVFSGLTKTYSGKERISSTSRLLGRWAPRTALQTIFTCALQHAPGSSSPTEGSKWKKETKPKKSQTLPISLMTYLSLSPVLNLGVLNRSIKTLHCLQEHLFYLIEIKPCLKKTQAFKLNLHTDL